MKRNTIIRKALVGMLILHSSLFTLNSVAQTLDELQQAARENYPLIKQHELIQLSRDYTLSNIKRGWLPQVSATAQATYQSDVTAWPDDIKSRFQAMGIDMKGMGKAQYKVGIDVSQTVWEGGRISAASRVAQAQADAQEAQTEVTLYQVRKRVNDLYFGILLLDEQLKVNHDLQALYESNINKVEGLVRNGVALQSDADAIRAELMSAKQKETELSTMREAAREMLAMLAPLSAPEGATLELPTIEAPIPEQGSPTRSLSGTVGGSARPELRLFDSNNLIYAAQERQLRSGLMPQLSIFAQGFYGYPGYNMFDSMMNRDMSLNGMIGARISWNIGSLYTNKNDRRRLANLREMNEVNRQTFLFNNAIEQTQAQREIEKYRQLLAQDDEIVKLRQSVRKATEAKLSHGIIDTNELVNQITKENAALQQRAIHEIDYLSAKYNLKYVEGK